MAIVDDRHSPDGGGSGSKVWGLFKIPFRSSNSSTPHTTSSSSSYQIEGYTAHNTTTTNNNNHSSGSTSSVSSVARSLLPTRRRLRLDPAISSTFLFCMKFFSLWTQVHAKVLGIEYVLSNSHDEPGKQVQSAIKIKNTSKSHVAFKFQTTAPKSCFMRPPGAILAPGETIIATVFKFVEPPENNERPMDLKRKVKFKIMSLKVKGMMDYVPELFDEQKDQVAVEQILQVVFLDIEHPSPALEKLKLRLAEAEAALESRKKPPEEIGTKIVGEGLVIDEWKERRERYLARQQVEGVDSV
ncbi:hypothetical protein R6Q57_015766 [Mikania cordata]